MPQCALPLPLRLQLPLPLPLPLLKITPTSPAPALGCAAKGCRVRGITSLGRPLPKMSLGCHAQRSDQTSTHGARSLGSPAHYVLVQAATATPTPFGAEASFHGTRRRERNGNLSVDGLLNCQLSF